MLTVLIPFCVLGWLMAGFGWAWWWIDQASVHVLEAEVARLQGEAAAAQASQVDLQLQSNIRELLARDNADLYSRIDRACRVLNGLDPADDPPTDCHADDPA